MFYDNIIKQILSKRGITDAEQVNKFLNPSIKDILNPFDLNGMSNATQKIEQAIKQNQTILIYGDYDADGICSVSMLYLYLKKRGANVFGFIPNRHTDGYGLSDDTIDQICNEYFADLIITVDTGISAREQIDTLLELGIDVIVTDHHEPPELLPNCIVVDPKLPNQKYSFNGLSGAGVAFKLIQALSGLDEALNYIDICAISTVGDIVPLLDENRIITILGLNKINGDNVRPSIAYLKKQLKLQTITSSDISFKIVPRLNASGRMDSAFKCVEFLIETDPQKLQQLFEQIEADNNERLLQSAEIQNKINNQLANLNFNNQGAIFIKDDNINLGLIGIISSKLCSIYNRPVFVFSKSEDDNLKCSIRSIDGINVFEVLDKYRDKLINVGGHSLAGGLTISPDYYTEFVNNVSKDINELYKTLPNQTELEYDAIIDEKDININLLTALKKLEPCGFKNPRPEFLLNLTNVNYFAMKSYKHYKIVTPTKKEIVSFFGYKYKPIMLNSNQKQLIVTIEEDNFLSKPRVKAMLKNVSCDNLELPNNFNYGFLQSLYNLHQSLNVNNNSVVFSKNLKEQTDNLLKLQYQTIIISNNYSTCKKLYKEYNIPIVATPFVSGKTCILYNPCSILNINDLVLYKNIIFADGYYFNQEYNYLKGKNVYVYDNKLPYNITVTREVFANYYKHIISKPIGGANDFIDYSLKLTTNGLDINYLGVVLLACTELGFIKIDTTDSFVVYNNKIKQKNDLKNSKLLNIINQ